MPTLAKYNFKATDGNGTLLTNVKVTVTPSSGATLPQLYSDREATVAIGNPYVSASGQGGFHVRGGAYTVLIEKDAESISQTYIAIGRAQETDLTLVQPLGTWSAATTYIIGDYVTVGFMGFVSLIDANLNNAPDNGTPGDNASWMYIGIVAGDPAGIEYLWSTTTTDSDPGAGNIRGNNATQSLITNLYVDNVDVLAADWAAFLDTLGNSTSTIKAKLTIRSATVPAEFLQFNVTGSVTDGTGYRKIPVTYVGAFGTINDTDSVWLQFTIVGDKGTTGSAGPTGPAGGGLADVVNDATPQLGGALDVNGKAIVSVSDGDITITPNGTGDVVLDGQKWPQADGSSNQVLETSGTGQLSWVAQSGGSSANEALFALEIADLKGDRMGMNGGIADPYDDETDIDTATSTNEVYDAANDLYSPSAGAGSQIGDGVGTAIGNMLDFGGLAAAFDGATSQVKNSSAVSTDNLSAVYIGKNYSAAQTAISKVTCFGSNNEGYISGSNPSITLELYAKTGSVPANSTDGTLLGSISFTDTANESTGRDITSSDTSTVWDHAWIRITGTTLDKCVAELRFFGPGSTNNMTLVSNTFTALSQGNNGRLAVQVIENESITINTDLTGEVSRDGGTTWTAGTLVLVATTGTVKLYEDNTINISGQPAGTAMEYRIKTLNNKDIDVSGVVFQWS